MLPSNHPHRLALEAEIHARPHARIRIPALVTNISLMNEGVGLAEELAALRQLPNQAGLLMDDLKHNFLRVRIDDYMLKWERHGEFTRYSITQPLPSSAGWGINNPPLLPLLKVPANWLSTLPGKTISATQLVLIPVTTQSDEDMLIGARLWLGAEQVVAARIGAGYATAFTDFRLREDGFTRYLAIAESLTETRAGRVSSRLLELEIYRVLALLAFPVANTLKSLLKEAEIKLAEITSAMENTQQSDSDLLHELITLAARVEVAIANHSFRFAATKAYENLVQTRIHELREIRLHGVLTFSEFLNRRFVPAMATVAATQRRLESLSERIERSSALIRTRADIVREEQNQNLLEKLNQGQRLQLRMQQTVEGLSIAAISYYTLSLLGYGFKALKAMGVSINTDVATGIAVPLVLVLVWRVTTKLHETLKRKL